MSDTKKTGLANSGTQREKILRGAMEVFSRMGYDTASVTEIARHAEVSRASIYQYFNNKDHLFRATVEWFHEISLRATDAVMTNDAYSIEDKIFHIIDARVGQASRLFMSSDPGVDLRAIIYERARDLLSKQTKIYVQKIARLLRDADRAKRISLKSVEMSAYEVAEILVAGARGQRSELGYPVSEEEHQRRLRRFVDLYLNGLR